MVKKFMVLITVVGSLFILLRKGKFKNISNSSSCNSTFKKGQTIGSTKSIPITGKCIGSVGPITTIGRVGSTSNINR